MNLITELTLILGICLAGEGIAALLPVAFPASVISMVLLMLLLLTGAVKESRISTLSGFLMANMGLFFIPSLVGTLRYAQLLQSQLLPFLAVTFLTTPVVYLVTGRTVQLLMRKQRGKGAPPMAEVLCSSPLFGLVLSMLCWYVGVRLQKKTGLLLCNPVLVASALIIAVLLIFDIPLTHYEQGGELLKLMLGPATAVLALNIYRHRQVLGEHFLPVLGGCLAGSLASMGCVLLLCRLLGTDSVFTASLLPKSVTTAIALGISEQGGGIGGLTAAAVILTGVEGAMLAPVLARLFRIQDPVAEGTAIGACSHAIGTTAALEIGSLQGAMSSIAICVCGIVTCVLAMFF